MKKTFIIYSLLIILIVFFFTKNSASSHHKVQVKNSLFAVSTSLEKEDTSFDFSDEFKLEMERIAYKYPLKELQNYADKLKRIYGFNGSILIAKNGKILFEENIGYKNLRYKNEEINFQSTFQLASLSKQFTASAILLLYQQGKLDLDDYAIKYLPDFPYSNITIRHLLNHVSGLPNYMFAAEHNWNRESPPDNFEMLSLMNKLKMQIYFSPGRRFDYSNTGYFVLATIVEKISSQNFGHFLEDNFFKPLNMNNTYVHNTKENNDSENELIGFRRYGRSYRTIPFTINDGVVGDKGVYSTVHDLFKWDLSLTNNTILTDTILNKAFTSGKTNRGREIPYGFGFRLKSEKDTALIYHNGVWNGFTNTFRKYESDKITIIVLSNNSFNAISTISDNLYELSKEFSKYDNLLSVIENNDISDLPNLFNSFNYFKGIPKMVQEDILQHIIDLNDKYNYKFYPLRYLELAHKQKLNPRYGSLLN